MIGGFPSCSEVNIIVALIHAGTEKKNDEAKRTFFKSSNKWDAAKDILKYEYILNVLKYFERTKQTYRYVKYGYIYH